MLTPSDSVVISSFACEFGDLERSPKSIECFADICASKGLGGDFESLGCGSFWQMTKSVELYIVKSVAETIAASQVSPEEISHIVFATSNVNLRYLDYDLVRSVLRRLNLVNCVPMVISLQLCASSLVALNNCCHQLMWDTKANHMVLVAFDLVVDDKDRIQSFALFGDAVATCMISRDRVAGFSLLSHAVNLDFVGLFGEDDFASRKKTAILTLDGVLQEAGSSLGDVKKIFSTNLYKPLAIYNARSCGIDRNKLYIDTLQARAHCGNCDWMINLMHYRQHCGLGSGEKYLVQSFAPGFVAYGLLGSL